MAILNSVMFDDGEMSVRIKPLAGHGVQGGGLVWRYRDENNYYLARANVLEKTVSLYKVQNGQRTSSSPPSRRPHDRARRADRRAAGAARRQTASCGTP